MATIARWWSHSVLTGLALGTLLAPGCASFGKSDRPSSQASSQPRPISSVTGGDELERRLERREAELERREAEIERKEAVANGPEREKMAAQRLTMNGRKPLDLSTKPTPEGGGEKGGASVAGAVRAVAQPMPAMFPERRASEAFDRLAATVAIRHEKRGAVITLPSDRLVESGQWTLTTGAQYTLRELAVGLRDQGGRTMRIQGYTDSMGTPAVNDALSLRRAEAVRDFLILQGVAAETMRAEGMGAKRPLATNETAEGRAQNRRIEIVIAPLE